MDHANPAAKSMDYGSFSDEDLIRRYCSDPPDRDAGEELARRCLSKLSDFVRRQVFGKGICPPGHSGQIFFEDSCDLAIENFTRGIRSYRSEGDLDAWLNRICINAVLTIWRKHVGRG